MRRALNYGSEGTLYAYMCARAYGTIVPMGTRKHLHGFRYDTSTRTRRAYSKGRTLGRGLLFFIVKQRESCQ